MNAISTLDAAPAIALPDDDEQLRKLIAGTGANAEAVRPIAVSAGGRGIPVTPQTPGRAIPINRATGAPEELNNQGKPIAPGIAGLWARADNIHNPFLRALGKIGAVGARAIDVAGSVAAPGAMAQIPGTALNQKVEEASANRNRAADDRSAMAQAETAHTQAETSRVPPEIEHTQAETKALSAPKAEKPENVQQLYADAVQESLEKGEDPNQNPKVKQLADAITGIQKEAQSKEPNRDDRAIGIMAKPKEQWTPEEAAYMRGYDQYVQKTKVQPGVSRAQIYLQGREMPAIDTQNNNALTFANPNQINSAPGRFVPQAGGAKALGQTALIEDIRGNIQQTRDSLKNPKMPEFDATQRAQIAIALGGSDPASAISAAFRGGVLGNLSSEQQEYLINLAQLVENSMAMRSVLGAGQGSDDMRRAIRGTIPGPNTPSKEYALKQLDKFEAVLNRLEKGIPQVPLAKGNGNEAQISDHDPLGILK